MPVGLPAIAGNGRRWALTLAIVAASVGIRVWSRGDLIPGWDVLGAAQGAWLLANRTPGEIVAWYHAKHGDISVFWNLYVLPAVLVPGALARLVPWLYWNHVVAGAVTGAVLLLLASAFRLGWRSGWLVLLAWTTSSALVSQSVTGLAAVTALLPHALAVWVVVRLRERPVWSLLAGGAIWFLGWHGQELGRTACLTLLAAAVVTRTPPSTRLAWLAAGGLLLFDSLRFPTANTESFTSVGVPSPAHVVELARGIAARLVAPPWIDLPTLLATGLVACVLVRTDGWLWRATLLLHLALTLVLALQRGEQAVWPRRFLVVDFYALVAVVAFGVECLRRSRERALRAIVVVLFAGALWQLADTVRFVRNGFEVTGGGDGIFSLPFVHTTVDYQTVPQDVLWTRAMLADVHAGRRLILAYNHSSYEENSTNPSGVPERLYLALGAEAFARDVAYFGTAQGRTDVGPRRPEDIDAFVESIDDPVRWVGWYTLHPADEWDSPDAHRRRAEVDALLSALERRFTLRWDAPLPGRPSHIQRFTLAPRAQ